MLSVAEARARVLALGQLTDIEQVKLTAAHGRVLAEDLIATHDQPPFRTATMDGYAVFGSDGRVGDCFTVIGQARAGEAFRGALTTGQAIRIFTGAPVPDSSTRVIIQEDVAVDGSKAAQISARSAQISGSDKGFQDRAGCHHLTSRWRRQ